VQGRPDQGLPGRPNRPDQGLPGYGHADQGLPGQGGRPDQGLPGRDRPTDPGYDRPSFPGYGSGQPVYPGGPVDPGYGGGRPAGPDSGYDRPSWGGRPDQGLPGSGGRPDQGLPPTATPKAYSVPEEPVGAPSADGDWIVATYNDQATWVWLPKPPEGTTKPVEPDAGSGSIDNTLPTTPGDGHEGEAGGPNEPAPKSY
jgi:hypothetical protein